MAEITENIIKNHPELIGLYHLSVAPIDKCSLLNMVKKEYRKDISIEPYPDFHIDRSLNSSSLRKNMNFTPQVWDDLIVKMHNEYMEYFKGL